MLDTETDLVHFFRKTKDNKPYQSLSLNVGVLTNDLHTEQEIIDQNTGERLLGFKFQFKTKSGKKKGKQLTVLPESPE